MFVREIMERVVFLPHHTTIAEAAREMVRRHTECVLVNGSDTPIGIVTEKDILKKVVAESRDSRVYTLKDIMSTPVISIKAASHLYQATEKMDEHGIRRLPVIEDGMIVGIVTATTISKNYKYVVSKYLTTPYTRAVFLEEKSI